MEPGFFDITSVKTTIPVLKIKPSKFTLPFGCGTVMYPNYYPREPFSLHELPEAIQAKIKAYLIGRVGKSFYKNIVLNGGQLVDLKAFYKINPKIKKKEWEPPAFSLCFMVWDTETRQSLYNFQLEMDADGKLKKLIPLPDIIHYPAKAHILKLIEAKAIAKTYGFDKPYTQTKAYYYPKAKSIVWEFEYHDQGEGELVSSKLLIDAHSGKIADRLSSRITVNY